MEFLTVKLTGAMGIPGDTSCCPPRKFLFLSTPPGVASRWDSHEVSEVATPLFSGFALLKL